MENNKQTAVEWLEKEFVKLESTIGVHGIMYELIEQAKEMFENQIMDAFNEGVNDECLGKNTTPKQYFKQTFGENNEQ